MRKTATFIILMILCGVFLTAVGQKTPALKNGSSIKAQLGFPSIDFGWTDELSGEFPDDFKEEYKYGITYGLQAGHQWYFYKPESLGIGLMVNWLDVTGTIKKYSDSQELIKRATLDVGVLEFGPVFTYAIDDPMAIDVYYNLRPTALMTGYRYIDEEEGENEDGFGGYGVTHAFGAGFRLRLLYAGVEYVTGSTKVSRDSSDDEIWKDRKMKADCFRIVVGVKF